MNSEKNRQAFVAGNSSDGTTWLQSTPGVLSYDDYMMILWMLVGDMKDDLGRRLDKTEFEADMADIVRTVTKKPKHPRAPISPESIELPELKLKEIASGDKKTMSIRLDDIRKVQMFDDHFVITTATGFVSFIPREMYQVLADMTSKQEAVSSMAHRRIQYILFAYAKTTASVQRIVSYASENQIFEDSRQTEAEKAKKQAEFFSEILGKQKRELPDNVIDFSDPDRKE